ncbi:MAG TPA: hypothetical protein EYP82_07275 [Hydrogenothermaceae bacterium]|nr:hypothetical protein [Hydrogenothermaceae bacterium]
MKKILVFLAFINLGFAGPFDIEDNFYNETAASKWQDPTSGVTFYSGPNFEYRFKDETATVAPWLQMQLPSAKIGCNGLSLKGGFMALLGLDDIKLQLENAGPTFAWGVLTTIEISMPSVAAIFQKIQQWVRKIQGLLQNACSSGQLAGNWLKKNYGWGKFEGGIIEEGADKILGAMDSVEEKLEAIATLDDDNNSTKKSVASDKLHKIGSGLSFLAMDFGKAIGECKVSPDFAGKNKVDFSADMILSGTIESCDIKAKMTEDVFARNALSYMLARTLFGELVVTPGSLTPLVELFKPDGKFDVETTKRELKSVVARSETPFGEIEYSVYPPVIGDPRKAADFLVHGKRDSYGNALQINIPNINAMYVKFKYADATDDHLVTDENGSVEGSGSIFSSPTATGENFEVRAIFTTRPQGNSDMISNPLEWRGLVVESRENILTYLKAALKRKVGDARTSNLFGAISAPSKDLSTSKTPMLVSGMHRYLNVLTQEAIERGGVYTVMPLVELLAEYNAELFAEQLLSRIMEQIEAAEGGPNLITTEHTRKGYADFKKRVLIVFHSMQKQLREMRKDTVHDAQKVPGIFGELEKKMNERRIGKLRGQ